MAEELAQTIQEAERSRERAAQLRDTAAPERARAKCDAAMAGREREIVIRLVAGRPTPLRREQDGAPEHDGNLTPDGARPPRPEQHGAPEQDGRLGHTERAQSG
jgi:hypothetical protein